MNKTCFDPQSKQGQNEGTLVLLLDHTQLCFSGGGFPPLMFAKATQTSFKKRHFKLELMDLWEWVNPPAFVGGKPTGLWEYQKEF